MAGIGAKTVFEYKGIMRQIAEWREAYIREYESYPAVIEMSEEARLELERVLTRECLYYRIDPNARDSVMGMLIQVRT